MTPQQNFDTVAPQYMKLLLQDFPMLTVLDAAAVFGNAGHESKGLTDDQEDKPVVRGSRGGLNWMQWTGPRRRAFEAYCNRNSLDANSDEAAYKWLFVELKGEESKAIPALLSAKTLDEKVVAFEKAFLRAGVKHYPSRKEWAARALAAYNAAYSRETSRPELPSGNTETPAVPERLPAPGNVKAPSWLAGALIFLFAALVAVAVWIFGLQLPETPLPLLGGAPIPMDRPAFFTESTNGIWQGIAMQILLSFLGPIIAAAAAWLVGQISYWWLRLLKVNFDQRSSERLHAALERAIYAGIEVLGANASKGKLQAFAADYAMTYNPSDVSRFKLTDGDLQELALPHIGKFKRETVK